MFKGCVKRQGVKMADCKATVKSWLKGAHDRATIGKKKRAESKKDRDSVYHSITFFADITTKEVIE